jgi:hypothetical protein
MTPSPLDAATIEGHIAKARRNYGLYEQFRDIGRELDWAVTFLFYVTVHLVQAHACQFSPAALPVSHAGRHDYVAAYLPDIEVEYDLLYQGSVSARYTLSSFSTEDVAYYHEALFAPVRDELARLNILW